MRAILILLALLALPISEVAVFAWSGEAIGVWPTVALTLMTAAAGAAMIRSQGLGLIRRTQAEMDRCESPQRELIEGAALALAGVCLLTPGFITDAIGFCLLIAPLRRRLAQNFMARAKTPPPGGATIIDVDYVDLTQADPTLRADTALDSPDRPR